jgi:hypothetical protein
MSILLATMAAMLTAIFCLPLTITSFVIPIIQLPITVERRSQSYHSHLRAIFQPVGDAELATTETTSSFPDEEKSDVNIPTTGISVSDELEAAQKDRFVTELIPINGLRGAAAQLVTMPTATGSFEPVRYLVALSPPTLEQVTPIEDVENEKSALLSNFNNITDFVIMDIPPFAPHLVRLIKEYVGRYNGRVRSILVTCRDSIHYNEAPAIYSTRRTDLELWCNAFPDLNIIAYRLDIPRDCRFAVTQVLDGYGPFALEEENRGSDKFQFIESGRPLTFAEWDHSVAQDVFCGKPPPDDTSIEREIDNDETDVYTPNELRKREKGKRVLAIYTPGYSFGSMSYVFPDTGVCCSGYTIPIEDNRYDENLGIGGSTGPALDGRGYIANSRDRTRQMESAKYLINTYIDRFRVVLPSRGDPLFLDDNVEGRKEFLLETITQYEKIGAIYERPSSD